MHCMYSGMAKGTSWAEAMSNSKKIKSVALPLLSYASLKVSGRQLVSQSVENLLNN